MATDFADDETLAVDGRASESPSDGGASFDPEATQMATGEATPRPERAAPSAGHPHRLTRGEHVGRYVILDVVGHGGMGVVYAAYDPQLDRKIALKLVLAPEGARREQESERLLREAQALARLSHPNVVTVYDAGTVGDQVFIAMEFVEGETLGRWLRGEPTVPRRLEIMRAAGRGLAAAHAAGILHRDFKPDNVMVGRDGRVRVMDFGLARAEGEERAPAHASRATGPRDAPRDAPTAPNASLSDAEIRDATMLESGSAGGPALTRTGALMGTPAYMSPEQFASEGVEARSDQFSFFVVLYEVLYGRRPFVADSFVALAAKVTSGDFAAPPPLAGVTAHLRTAIERGLSAERDRRFASMQEALEALAPPSHGARTWLVGAAGVLILGGAAALAFRPEAGPPPCAGAKAAATRAWTEDARTQITASFEATGAPFAKEAATRVIKALGTYGEAQGDARHQVCAATQIEGTQSAALMDRRTQCLDDARRQFEALIEVLQHADTETAQHALDAVAELPDGVACLDIEADDAILAPPPAGARETVTELEAELAAISALGRAGHYEETRERLEAIEGSVMELDYLPLRAEWNRLNARSLAARGKPEAEAAFVTALKDAVALGQPDAEVRAAGALVRRLTGGEHSDTAAYWLDLLEALVARHGERPEHRLELLEARLSQSRAADDLSAGIQLATETLELLDEVAPDDVARRIDLLRARADPLTRSHQIEKARADIDRAAALAEAHYGPSHPANLDIASAYQQLASQSSQHDEAQRIGRELVERAEATYGPDSRQSASFYDSFALSLARARKYEEAEPYFQRAIAVGVSDPAFARLEAAARGNYGTSLFFQGRHEEAKVQYERALELRRTLAESGTALAMAQDNLAAVLAVTGDPARALELHLEAFEGLREEFGSDSPVLAVSLRDQATALIALERDEEAIATLRRALFIYESRPDVADPASAAELRTTLAELLAPRSAEGRAEARKLASEVRAVAGNFGPMGEQLEARLKAARL